MKKSILSTGLVAAALVAAPSMAQTPGQEWPPAAPPMDQQMDPGPGWPPRLVEVRYPLPGKDFREDFVEVDGWRIRYIEAGQGETLVFMPGSGGLEYSTAKDMLSREYRVIEINPPGWGPDELNTRVRDMKDMGQTFLRVLDRIGVQQFHVVGTSMGCTHAMWMALHAPQRVLSLTSEGGECSARGPDTRMVQTDRAVATQQRGQQEGVWDHDPEIWSGWPAYQWIPNKWWATPSYQSQIMYRRFVKNFPYNRNANRDEMLAAAKDMRVPTVNLLGDRDEVMNLKTLGYWRRDIPRARLVVVAGATHDIQNSQPEQFVELIKACSLDVRPHKPRCPND